MWKTLDKIQVICYNKRTKINYIFGTYTHDKHMGEMGTITQLKQQHKKYNSGR